MNRYVAKIQLYADKHMVECLSIFYAGSLRQACAAIKDMHGRAAFIASIKENDIDVLEGARELMDYV